MSTNRRMDGQQDVISSHTLPTSGGQQEMNQHSERTQRTHKEEKQFTQKFNDMVGFDFFEESEEGCK